jgi:predicted amino acid dehydrogenase
MKDKKNRFAFIAHPMKREDILNFYPLLRFSSFMAERYNFKDMARNLPINKFIDLKANISDTDKSISGMGIVCPLFPEDFVKLQERIVLDKIKKACLLAQREGAGIIGLGGFTSIVGNEGEVLAKEIDAGITSGNTYTAYLALEGIFKAAELMQIDLSCATAAVIGATGDIGSICTRVLSKRVKHINLVARHENRLEEFAEEIRSLNSTSVFITKYIPEAIREADIILTATSSLTTIIEPTQLKSGCVVCDVALPPNIAREVYDIRKDVLVFEGGKAKLPKLEKIKSEFWQKYFPENIIVGCLAETMLLALENYFKDFSIGRGKITEEKLDFIAKVARKHGFTLAPFRCGGKILDVEQINKIRKRTNELVRK